MFDVVARERKARTMVAILRNHMGARLDTLTLLNVGGSTGIIDSYLSRHFSKVISVDIDDDAIEYAQRTFKKDNLEFHRADAMNLPFANGSFDVAVSSQVYEHVPDAQRMFEEIYRILKPGGLCYFAANNRLMFNEPHYNLPFLSVIPRPLAHIYMRLSGRGRYYHEKHYTYWGLKSLVKKFRRVDYTRATIAEPEKFSTDYMIKPGSRKARIGLVVLKYAYWLSPGYIWLLTKPIHPDAES